MYDRMLIPPKNKSFFLFGPRGTGKSYWVKATFPNSVYLDLLEAELYIPLMANPQRLQEFIGKTTKQQWIIVDEVQKIPELLNEVHRLIEKNHYKFILTGSSARKLKKKGVNLLAGRALTYHLYPLTSSELGKDFVLNQSIQFGHLPSVFSEENPKKYLQSYIQTYLKEEIQQEGLTRNLGAFLRFLEAASFSQGSTINIAEVARECSVHRKVVEQYFVILEDLLLAKFLPVFTKRSKRRLLAHPKFYYFDVGIYRALRPRGPLDRSEEIDGHALETLFFQELTALNDYMQT
ncbi:MAG: putative AAA+ superfamily ATPase, partial [Candidatus Omnitrophota bacterium]